MLLEINPHTPEPRKIRRAVDALEAGDVIAYPTDTVYGLGCDLFNKRAVDRLYQLKGMPRSQKLAFVCRDLTDVARYAVMHDSVYRVLKEYLPGPYCFLLEATREDSPIARFLERRGGGIHHVCFASSDVRADQISLQAEGYELLRPEPTQGAGGCWVQFVHPKSASGVLVELSEKDPC